jgi:hypothetical protein
MFGWPRGGPNCVAAGWASRLNTNVYPVDVTDSYEWLYIYELLLLLLLLLFFTCLRNRGGEIRISDFVL